MSGPPLIDRFDYYPSSVTHSIANGIDIGVVR